MGLTYPDYGYPIYYWPDHYWPGIYGTTAAPAALPIRQQILSAIKTALSGSTAFNYVTDRKEQWWDWGQNRYPGVCIVVGDEEDIRFCFSDTTNSDMQSKMKVNVIGYVFDNRNELATKRSDMISDIETVVENSTAVQDLVQDIVLNTVRTDKGELENFSLVQCEFGLDYLYNKVNP
jgi:hypothetical protein